jgi:hypothetical protein
VQAPAFFARVIAPKMTYHCSPAGAAYGIPVAVTCRILGLAKQAF